MSTPGKLADVILGMTYGDLKDVGQALVDMMSDRDFDSTSSNDFADLLHNWAENLERPEDEP